MLQSPCVKVRRLTFTLAGASMATVVAVGNNAAGQQNTQPANKHTAIKHAVPLLLSHCEPRSACVCCGERPSQCKARGLMVDAATSPSKDSSGHLLVFLLMAPFSFFLNSLAAAPTGAGPAQTEWQTPTRSPVTSSWFIAPNHNTGAVSGV